MVFESNQSGLSLFEQFHASACRTYPYLPWHVESLYEVDPSMRRLRLFGLFKVTEMKRLRQVAGQLVEAVFLPVVGAQDMQRGYADTCQACGAGNFPRR